MFLNTRYADTHPKLIKTEDAALKAHYADQNPAGIPVKVKLDFLHQELSRSKVW